MDCSLLMATISWGIDFHNNFPQLWQVQVFLLLWPEELKQTTNRYCVSIRKKKKKKLKEGIWQPNVFSSGNQGLPYSSVDTRLWGFFSFSSFHPLPHAHFLGFNPSSHRCLVSISSTLLHFLKALVSRLSTTQVSVEWVLQLSRPTHEGSKIKQKLNQNQKSNQCVPFWGPLLSCFC